MLVFEVFRQWRSQNEAENAMLPRNKLAKIFTGDLYQFSTVKKTSVTDNIMDWPLLNDILGCATVSL